MPAHYQCPIWLISSHACAGSLPGTIDRPHLVCLKHIYSRGFVVSLQYIYSRVFVVSCRESMCNVSERESLLATLPAHGLHVLLGQSNGRIHISLAPECQRDVKLAVPQGLPLSDFRYRLLGCESLRHLERLNSVSDLVSNTWYRIPFDQSALSISKVPPTDSLTIRAGRNPSVNSPSDAEFKMSS